MHALLARPRCATILEVTQPAYASLLARVPETNPQDLVRLLEEAAAPLGVSDLTVYLADFERVALQPVLYRLEDDGVVPEEDIASSVAGRTFRTGAPAFIEREGGVHLWVPLVERGDRTGVLSLRLPELDEAKLAHCIELGIFSGLLVRSFSRVTDLLHLSRRRRSMTLAAGLQWDLLPPLTIRGRQVLICGLLEPAYEIAGDVFDYALNDRYLEVCLFDGMGHGVRSALLATLAVGAYRHSRRAGEALDAAYAQVDETICAEYGVEEFVTGILGRVNLDQGVLEWVNAGHLPPLLLRDGRVHSELECEVSLPFGIGGGRCEQVASARLRPGDDVLFYTDGVVEARSADGAELGTDGLAAIWERETLSGLPVEEVLRRVTREVVGYSAAKLTDDATLMVVHWQGRG